MTTENAAATGAYPHGRACPPITSTHPIFYRMPERLKRFMFTSKRRVPANDLTDGTRPPGYIPETFTYLSRESVTMAVTGRKTTISHMRRLHQQWGLAPLGYIPAKIVTWIIGADAWQPEGTEYGHPYMAIHWNDKRDFAGQWYARITIAVSDPPNMLPADMSDLHTRSVRGELSNFWTDITTGAPVHFGERNANAAPGVPVYTVLINSEEHFRQVLAEQDLILRTDADRYLVQAALMRL